MKHQFTSHNGREHRLIRNMMIPPEYSPHYRMYQLERQNWYLQQALLKGGAGFNMQPLVDREGQSRWNRYANFPMSSPLLPGGLRPFPLSPGPQPGLNWPLGTRARLAAQRQQYAPYEPGQRRRRRGLNVEPPNRGFGLDFEEPPPPPPDAPLYAGRAAMRRRPPRIREPGIPQGPYSVSRGRRGPRGEPYASDPNAGPRRGPRSGLPTSDQEVQQKQKKGSTAPTSPTSSPSAKLDTERKKTEQEIKGVQKTVSDLQESLKRWDAQVKKLQQDRKPIDERITKIRQDIAAAKKGAQDALTQIETMEENQRQFMVKSEGEDKALQKRFNEELDKAGVDPKRVAEVVAKFKQDRAKLLKDREDHVTSQKSAIAKLRTAEAAAKKASEDLDTNLKAALDQQRPIDDEMTKVSQQIKDGRSQLTKLEDQMKKLQQALKKFGENIARR